MPPAPQQLRDRLVDRQALRPQFVDRRVVLELVGEQQVGRRIEDVARHAFADGRRDVDLGEHTGLGAQRVEQPLLWLVHRQPALAVQHLDRLGLLAQQEHPVRTVEGCFHLRRAVVVVGALRRGAERAAVFAGAAGCFLDDGGLDGVVGANVAQLLLQLVDEEHLAPVARQVHLAGDLVQQQDVDHCMQIGPALEFLVLDDDEVVLEVDAVAALEEALVLAAPGIGVEHDRQVLDARVFAHAQLLDRAGLEGVAQRGDGQLVAVRAEQLEHHRRDGLVLDLVQRPRHRGHL
mmetsp:Transcript_41597/g.97608  ORF Transcript_41597/g.97608 Transcript_41597/m.97608 type:complete len:291 (+) Transcript_41597:255-1127(+)